MEQFIDESPEVVTPETETPEVVTPEVSVEQEVAEPDKVGQSHEDNAKFKEQRLKYEKQMEDLKKSISDDFTKQIEAIKAEYSKTNEELMSYRQERERADKETKLRAYAEENGYDFDELKKQVELDEQRENELASKDSKIQEYETVIADKDNRISDLEVELENLEHVAHEVDHARDLGV